MRVDNGRRVAFTGIDAQGLFVKGFINRLELNRVHDRCYQKPCEKMNTVPSLVRYSNQYGTLWPRAMTGCRRDTARKRHSNYE
ncbi:hypothetical protein BAUCODRAFT_266989 [Baudoinia panamericana UAMH 10762]|uniref:Uncharacterized protein n=1 Tax=Baudoinia panamericana (strain UAMH 10762) TaxID=717646 RepID=M2M961_BAUPA|nr:uncharacterized protein BAUCODRAFT_266989 [Baudoinia panamericana UAMH 10762]EMC92931.1 hypothetical protein BAUCODRAFT_266989 [Baudoinia panamericana UAMH 10762]